MEQEQTRIKVNKGVDKQLVILDLKINYLIGFAFFVFVGVVIVMSMFSFKIFMVIAIFLAIIYMLIKYLQEIEFLNNFKKSKIPDELINDIF
jgi:hypothetical protein